MRPPFDSSSNCSVVRRRYVFTGPPAANGAGIVEQCRIVCDDERDGVWPSDHFGLCAELRTAPLPDAGASANDQAVARSSTTG